MLHDSSAPTVPAFGVVFHVPDHSRSDTDPPDPDRLHDPPHSPSAMDISLSAFLALTLNCAPLGMHVPSSVYTLIAPLSSPQPVVEYESLPTICFECGKYGHVRDICPTTGTEKTKDVAPSSGFPVSPAAPSPDEPFGPWMKVERHQRRIVRKGSSSKAGSSDPAVKGSHFNPLFEEDTFVAIASLGDLPQQVDIVSEHVPINTESQNHTYVVHNSKGKSQVKSPPTRQRPLTITEPQVPTSVERLNLGKSQAKSPPAKQRSPTTVQKPLSVQRPAATPAFKPTLLPTRHNSSLSSARFAPFPRQSSRSSNSKNTAVVVAENDVPTAPGCDSLPEQVHNSPVVVNPLFGAVMTPNLEDKQVEGQALPTTAVSALDEGLTGAQLTDQ
ncbi:hypothetical protein V6N13_076578 [Hibiscus sabdariffa]